MYSMYIIIRRALIYCRIKGSHGDEEEEEADVILSLGLSWSDAAGRAGQTIKAVVRESLTLPRPTFTEMIVRNARN